MCRINNYKLDATIHNARFDTLQINLNEGDTPESIEFGMPEINKDFLSTERHNFREIVIGIRSQKPGQGAVVLLWSKTYILKMEDPE